MGLPPDLSAQVVAIEPCPPIKSGSGRVVLTTVNHLSNNVCELSVEDAAGRRETIRRSDSIQEGRSRPIDDG